MSQPKAEETIQRLAIQLNELQEAINTIQSRLAALSAELEEVRLASETISNIEKFKQQEVLVALDRRGYAYAKASLQLLDKILVHIGQDLYALLPLDKARSVLMQREKDLVNAIQETEAELKKLTEIYAQLQKKLQEYVASLRQASAEKAHGGQ